MFLYRITTGGLMYNYKTHLQGSYKKLADAMEKVETERNFNSYAEDPAAASKAFQLRRDHWRNAAHTRNNSNVYSTFSQAYDTVDQVKNKLGYFLANDGTLVGLNTPDASGRNALGQSILEAANAAVQSMNANYAGNFIFAGADGLNVPFEWSEDGKTLLFRGVDVSGNGTKLDANGQKISDGGLLALDDMNNETTYVDIGLGMAENIDGQPIVSTVYNSALSGIDFLGYGTDEDGDPKNAIMIMKQIGDILMNCSSEDGKFAKPEDEETLNRLSKKLQTSLDDMNTKFVELATKAQFLQTNEEKLKDEKDTLNKQVLEVEKMGPAEAITLMIYAQYAYNAALKIGMNILSESLIDYMK